MSHKSVKKLQAVKQLPGHGKLLNQSSHYKAIAEKYFNRREFIFIGRGLNYPTHLGRFKIKRNYIHATGYPAGELKHGPIALTDEALPCVCTQLYHL